MSRSRKNHPIVKDYSRSSTRDYKRFASKFIRRYTGIIIDGNHYRKLYDSWNIHDYKYSSYWMDDDNDYWTNIFKRK